MTEFAGEDDVPLIKRVGFDYLGAVLELLAVMSYAELARAIGYSSKGAISKILQGGVPTHAHGEAIWVVYREKFGEKPPMSTYQQQGHT